MDLKREPDARKRKTWTPMQVKSLGKITDIIKSGGAKLGLSGEGLRTRRKPKND